MKFDILFSSVTTVILALVLLYFEYSVKKSKYADFFSKKLDESKRLVDLKKANSMMKPILMTNLSLGVMGGSSALAIDFSIIALWSTDEKYLKTLLSFMENYRFNFLFWIILLFAHLFIMYYVFNLKAKSELALLEDIKLNAERALYNSRMYRITTDTIGLVMLFSSMTLLTYR